MLCLFFFLSLFLKKKIVLLSFPIFFCFSCFFFFFNVEGLCFQNEFFCIWTKLVWPNLVLSKLVLAKVGFACHEHVHKIVITLRIVSHFCNMIFMTFVLSSLQAVSGRFVGLHNACIF